MFTLNISSNSTDFAIKLEGKTKRESYCVSWQLFKMEDVSMGMWVEQFNSSKAVKYVHSFKYCQFGCIEEYYTAHYQSPRQMICLWNKLQRQVKPECCNMRWWTWETYCSQSVSQSVNAHFWLAWTWWISCLVLYIISSLAFRQILVPVEKKKKIYLFSLPNINSLFLELFVFIWFLLLGLYLGLLVVAWF